MKSTAEKLKLAREQRAASREKVVVLTEKMGLPEWDDLVDNPLLLTEQRNWSRLNQQVESFETILATEKTDLGDDGITPAIIVNPNKDTQDGVKKRYSFFRAIRQANGKRDGLELEMHTEGLREARMAQVDDIPDDLAPGFMVPSFISHQTSGRERRDMVVGTPTAGGNTVATNLGDLIPFLDPVMNIRRLGARYLTGLVGNLELPRRTARATGGWAAEIAALAESNPTFDKITLTPKRVGTFINSSVQLFAQSSVDVENLIRSDLQECIARTLEIAALNGTGTGSQPTGILNIAGIGSVVGGPNGLSPDWTHIVDLETALTAANASFGGLGYYTTPLIAGSLKKTNRDAGGGTYIWEGPAANGVGILNGYAAVTSNLMPSDLVKGSSSDCNAIIFGNWSELIIGQWAGLYITVNPFSLDTQSEVRVSVAGWFDLNVRHAASFSAMQDALVS